MSAIEMPVKTEVPQATIDKVTKWQEAVRQSNYWGDLELTLRKELFAENFKDPKPGTNRVPLGYGQDLVLDHRINYSVNTKACTEELAKPGSNLAPILKEITTIKYDCSGSKFRALSPEHQTLLADIITEKPGTPGLEIKKAKR